MEVALVFLGTQVLLLPPIISNSSFVASLITPLFACYSALAVMALAEDLAYSAVPLAGSGAGTATLPRFLVLAPGKVLF